MDFYPDRAKGVYLATPFCSVNSASLSVRVIHDRTAYCGPCAALIV